MVWLGALRSLNFGLQEPRSSQTGKLEWNYCRDQNDSGSGKGFPELVALRLLTLLQDRPCLGVGQIYVKSRSKTGFRTRKPMVDLL